MQCVARDDKDPSDDRMAELAGLNREDPVGAIASFGWQRRSGTQLEVQLTNKVVGETEGETTRVAESLQRGEPPDGDASDAQFAGPDRDEHPVEERVEVVRRRRVRVGGVGEAGGCASNLRWLDGSRTGRSEPAPRTLNLPSARLAPVVNISAAAPGAGSQLVPCATTSELFAGHAVGKGRRDECLGHPGEDFDRFVAGQVGDVRRPHNGIGSEERG